MDLNRLSIPAAQSVRGKCELSTGTRKNRGQTTFFRPTSVAEIVVCPLFIMDAALEVMWQDLVGDRRGGVTAVVHQISEQIESAVTNFLQIPLPPSMLDSSGLF